MTATTRYTCRCGRSYDVEADQFPLLCPCGVRAEAMPNSAEPTAAGLALVEQLGLGEEVAAVAADRGLLLGDFIAQITTAVGIPPCGGCADRQAWLNAAHLRARDVIERARAAIQCPMPKPQ